MIVRRRGQLSLALLAGASAIAIASALPAAAEDAARSFDIPAQPLSSALLAYSRQTDTPVIASMDLLEGKTAPAIHGDMPQGQALAMLLQGTGLRAERGPTGSIVVERITADPQSGSAAGDGADGTVQALIVTAQKREENIQDVPIAMSAFTQEDLTRSQVAGGPDLITQVPNMTFTKTNFSSYSIQIRGIGTQAISATTDPAVAVAFNNTPFIRNRFFEQEFYDMQRVEVLRGPQGTLYGRNATGGVVNLISQKPKFVYESKLSADLGNYSSSRLEGMVNIPLVEDKVALRVAGAWTKRNGYVTNEISGNQTDGRDLWSTRVSLRVQPTDHINANLIWEHFQEDDDRLRSGKQLCKKDVVTHVGDVPITNYYNIRGGGGQGGSVMSGTQATFSQGCKRESLYDDSSFQRPNGLMLPYYLPLGSIGLPRNPNLFDPYVSVIDPALCLPGSCDPHLIDSINDQPENLRVIQSTVEPKYRARSDIGELQLSFDLSDNLTLSSETSYGTDFVYSLEDYNRFNTAPGAWVEPSQYDNREGLLTEGPNGGVFCDPQLGCSDRLVAVDVSTAKARQFSQEFRLQSSFSGPFNFSLGGNFLRADSEDKYYVFINSISLIAAGGASFAGYRPYVPGQSDNLDCEPFGALPGNPNDVYSVLNCVYVDPNPIESVNDKGHNYFLSKNPYKLISYAVFGEAYYQLAENLKVTAGLRWTVDKKKAPRIPTWILAGNSVGYPVDDVIDQEWREPTGRLALDWKPDLSFTEETLLYASIAHGYKAGGANPPGYVRTYYTSRAIALQDSTESATRPRTFAAEFVNAFEVGAKNTLDDGRVTLNLASFYYDYTGYQISEIVDRSAFNRNFDAKVWGAELEAEWRPLENVKIGFKGGYEKTRINDGQYAIDLMDRANGGKPDENGITWVVVRPFPTYASSCILPTYVFANPDGTIGDVGGIAGGGPSGCEIAYQYGWDPVTDAPYVDIAHGGVPVGGDPMWDNLNGQGSLYGPHPGYPGWDPSTAPNHGEGIAKPLGGNELPNAPHWTATVTGDYTLPLANEWLMTLHTDVHWQSQSWWRVFNDNAYDKLHPYFTMNLAAIFTNEDAGWNIMAYIKNVTDETAITGAFLNSDDTGLTTNVFLTEPRLYGLRVTKQWTGASSGWLSADEGPNPFTFELGGQIQRHDAPYDPLTPGAASEFHGPLNNLPSTQNRDLDWGDGREAKLTYRPAGSKWNIAVGVRYGKTNGHNTDLAEQTTEPVCGWGPPLEAFCSKYEGELFRTMASISRTNHALTDVFDREEHQVVDFSVGRDIELGGLTDSTFSLGLRKAHLESDTAIQLTGIPDWNIPAGFFTFFDPPPLIHNLYEISGKAHREFDGYGPVLSWDAAAPLVKLGSAGHADMTWSLSGGALFGDGKTRLTARQMTHHYDLTAAQLAGSSYGNGGLGASTQLTQTELMDETRTSHATVPTLGAELGLAYEVGGFKVGAGYRWERYFNAIDGGFEEHKSYDRTIDGPYFKIAVGFGG